MGIRRISRLSLAVALATGLSACQIAVPGRLAPDPAPSDVPDLTPMARPGPPATELAPSPQSEQLAYYYQRLQTDLQTRGLLRTDGGGPDTPFNDTMLARNFVRIALFSEYVSDGTVLEARQTISRLRRWETPVNLQVSYGDRVGADQRAKDSAAITNYAARLSRITGHPVGETEEGGNFHVLVLTEDDRLGFEDELRRLMPRIPESTLRTLINLDRTIYCAVVAFSTEQVPHYTQAVAVIRAEQPDLLRLACIHEELAQGLGLANDSPHARPSIFNDDEEFGLLTSHDEMLLRMLYDPRFSAGMTAAEAAPIARQIAREYLEGQS